MIKHNSTFHMNNNWFKDGKYILFLTSWSSLTFIKKQAINLETNKDNLPFVQIPTQSKRYHKNLYQQYH